MDKPHKGNTIIIKINGKKPATKAENQTTEQRKVKGQERPSVSGIAELEASAAKEPLEDGETFDWVLPTGESPSESTENQEIKVESNEKGAKSKSPLFLGNGKNMKQPGKRPITPIILTIFFAILVGVTFGFTMLKMVLPEQVMTSGEQPVVKTEQKSEEPVAAVGSGELTLPSLSASVIQEGLYTSQSGAEQIKSSLKEKGIPVEVFSMDGKFAIYIGVAGNVGDAKSMGQEYKDSGIDTFSKEFTIAEKKVTNLQEEEKKLLELATKMYQMLLSSLSNGIPTEMKATFEQQAADLTKIDKNKIQNKEMIIMHSELEALTAQIKKYDENPDPKILTAVQQHILTFLASYQKL